MLFRSYNKLADEKREAGGKMYRRILSIAALVGLAVEALGAVKDADEISKALQLVSLYGRHVLDLFSRAKREASLKVSNVHGRLALHHSGRMCTKCNESDGTCNCRVEYFIDDMCISKHISYTSGLSLSARRSLDPDTLHTTPRNGCKRERLSYARKAMDNNYVRMILCKEDSLVEDPKRRFTFNDKNLKGESCLCTEYCAYCECLRAKATAYILYRRNTYTPKNNKWDMKSLWNVTPKQDKKGLGAESDDDEGFKYKDDIFPEERADDSMQHFFSTDIFSASAFASAANLLKYLRKKQEIFTAIFSRHSKSFIVVFVGFLAVGVAFGMLKSRMNRDEDEDEEDGDDEEEQREAKGKNKHTFRGRSKRFKVKDFNAEKAYMLGLVNQFYDAVNHGRDDRVERLLEVFKDYGFASPDDVEDYYMTNDDWDSDQEWDVTEEEAWQNHWADEEKRYARIQRRRNALRDDNYYTDSDDDREKLPRDGEHNPVHLERAKYCICGSSNVTKRGRCRRCLKKKTAANKEYQIREKTPTLQKVDLNKLSIKKQPKVPTREAPQRGSYFVEVHEPIKGFIPMILDGTLTTASTVINDKKRYLIMPYHFIENGQELLFPTKWANGVYSQFTNVDKGRVVRPQDFADDFCMYDITNENVNYASARFVVKDKLDEKVNLYVHEWFPKDDGVVCNAVYLSSSRAPTKSTRPNEFVVDYKSEDGHCGSPVVGSEGVVVGYHVGTRGENNGNLFRRWTDPFRSAEASGGASDGSKN